MDPSTLSIVNLLIGSGLTRFITWFTSKRDERTESRKLRNEKVVELERLYEEVLQSSGALLMRVYLDSVRLSSDALILTQFLDEYARFDSKLLLESSDEIRKQYYETAFSVAMVVAALRNKMARQEDVQAQKLDSEHSAMQNQEKLARLMKKHIESLRQVKG